MSEFPLKPIDADAIPRALMKAERYRLLGEPEEAESICLDILAIEPDNQQALIVLVLTLTDQFRSDAAEYHARAQEVLPRLQGEYERCYYGGILCERRGTALLDKGGPGSGPAAYARLREAMSWYEKAEPIRPQHNDDAILRWNTCARIIAKHNLRPPAADTFEPALLE